MTNGNWPVTNDICHFSRAANCHLSFFSINDLRRYFLADGTEGLANRVFFHRNVLLNRIHFDRLITEAAAR